MITLKRMKGADAAVEHAIDLDRAAARITARIPGWREAGLTVGPLTWWDELASWPRPLETDRVRVEVPATVGLQLVDPATGAELHVVLFRGGWADVDYLAAGWMTGDGADAGTFPAHDITSAEDFEVRLVDWAAEVFGGRPACGEQLAENSGRQTANR